MFEFDPRDSGPGGIYAMNAGRAEVNGAPLPPPASVAAPAPSSENHDIAINFDEARGMVRITGCLPQMDFPRALARQIADLIMERTKSW